jgi:hypothetical protein
MSGENKWQLAFWIITAVCGVWLSSITCGVVENDRIRASEDQRIENGVDFKLDKIITIQTKQQIDMGKVLMKLGINE